MKDQIAELASRQAGDDCYTPDNSACGGKNFKPVGFAAKKAFKPYGDDQTTLNLNYNPKAKAYTEKPLTFNSNKTKFDNWV
jgi:hypothetical protein